MRRGYFLPQAMLPTGLARDVRLVAEDGVIDSVDAGRTPHPGDARLHGLAVPGFANAHSHAFHRALRGRADEGADDFWAWRRLMYQVAQRLDVESYERLATAVFAEMVLAGYTAVGEFHYVHHLPAGTPHDDANAMGDAIIAAAARAGIRLTLLDTMYLRGGLDAAGAPLAPDAVQRRFSDGDGGGWLARHELLRGDDRVRIGAAIHSVRAVDVPAIAGVLPALRGAPLHAHVSEQPAENAQSLAAFGATPVAVLRDAGALGPDFTAVHATHLAPQDIADLVASGSSACFCPTTERDLADGIGPAGALAAAGVPLCIGSDQHVVVDPFDELRALEGHERLASGRRGSFASTDLLRIGTSAGYRSLGWRGGVLEPGALCDLVTLDTASPRTAGARPERLWTAASSADVRDVVVAGERVVADRRHRLGDVGRRLADAVDEIVPGDAPQRD